MASKGITKTGDAYCLSCGAGVDASASRCQSCYSELDTEVKAFACPKCGKILELGTSRCGSCGMKFKVKSIRPSDAAEDERMVERLVGSTKTSAPASPDESETLAELLNALTSMADLRAEVASAMGTGISQTRSRISSLAGEDLRGALSAGLEEELKSISDDLSRLRELVDKADELAESVERILGLPGMEAIPERPGILGRTESMRKTSAQGTSSESFAEREQQIKNREDMVDRKIKAYAMKKKQLDELEESLKAKASGTTTADASATAPAAHPAWVEERRALEEKVAAISEMLSGSGVDEGDLAASLAAACDEVKRILASRKELEDKLATSTRCEEEIRQVMKVLDDLLGQLPEATIMKFTASEEFKLYQRVLDRLKI